MPNFRLRRGMHVEFRGREYVIDERLPNSQIRIRDIALNEFEPVSEATLLDALFDNQLEFLGDGRENSLVQRRMVEAFIDDIAMLENNDPRKKEFKRRHAYIKTIQNANLKKFTAVTLEPIIERVHEEIKDVKKLPNWKTVYYGWFVPFILAGEDVRAYVPSYKKRGNRKRKFTGTRKLKGQKFSKTERQKAEEAAQIVDDVINEEYMNEQRLSVAEVYHKLDLRIAEINEGRSAGDRLPLPHPDSLYDIISEMDEYEKDRARYGKLWAEKKHGQKKRGPRPTRPLQRVEIDHTKLDLFIVDSETRLPVGRPTITVIIDKYSRMILGIHVGFDPPGYLAVMLCLLHAIRRKSYLKTDFPDVENEWNTYGIPDVLVVDNGPEFHSEDLEDACLQLGTIILYNPVKHPWFKASSERFFGTENRRLLHQQPGTTFSNIFQREDYDSKKNAIISFDAFMEMLHIWLVDIYSHEIHRGLEDIPSDVWDAGIKEYPPRLPRKGQDLKVMIGQIEQRVIGPRGVRLFNLIYNDPKLALLRRELKGKKAKLKFNPDDLSIIHVHNPKDDSYIPVLAEDQEYTKGLHLWQHEVIKTYARKDVKNRRKPDALRRAKKKIQAIVDREWLKSGRSGARSRMARWKGIRQRSSGASLEMSIDQDKQDLNQSGIRDNLVMLNPPPVPAIAVSDVGNALAIHKRSDKSSGNGSNSRMPMPGVKEAVVVAENSKLKKCHVKSSVNDLKGDKDADPLESNAESITKMEPLTSEDDELDMAGYCASYDLPAHGGANE